LFFSIIIPSYNSAETIAATITSILEQTFTDFEILLMDSCSADATVQIVGRYKDSRIRIFSEKDKGIYDAMNKAIQLSEGNWLYFIGSDDVLYDKNVLQDVAGKLTELADKDLVYGNVYFNIAECFYDGVFDFDKLLARNICQQAIFYKRELLLHRSFNIKYPVLADHYENLLLFSGPSFKQAYIDVCIAIYNQQGISGTRIYQNYIESISILKSLLGQHYTASVKHKIKARIKSLYTDLVNYDVEKKSYRSAIINYFRSLAWSERNKKTIQNDFNRGKILFYKFIKRPKLLIL